MKVWKVILAAVVIFCAGVVTGGLTVKFELRPSLTPKPSSSLSGQRPRGDLATRMQRELSLTPSQRVQVDSLLGESKERTKKIWESANEEHRKVQENVRAVLTPDQQKKFEESFKRGPHKPGDGRSKEEGRTNEDHRSRGTSDPPMIVPRRPASSEKL